MLEAADVVLGTKSTVRVLVNVSHVRVHVKTHVHILDLLDANILKDKIDQHEVFGIFIAPAVTLLSHLDIQREMLSIVKRITLLSREGDILGRICEDGNNVMLRNSVRRITGRVRSNASLLNGAFIACSWPHFVKMLPAVASHGGIRHIIDFCPYP